MTDVLDSFAGVGWAVAARELGLEEEGIEIMKDAVATRDEAGFKTVHDDVWTYDYELHSHRGQIDSPPCQTFSAAGKGAGRKALDDVLRAIRENRWRGIKWLRELEASGDPRTALVLMPLHQWWMIQPEWVAWEQVPTVQPVWDACAEVMRDHGYSVWTGRLQAEQYGVPQTRKRSVLIASRTREVGMPEPTHSKYYSRTPAKLDLGVEKWMSMAEALNAPWHRMVSNYGTGGDPSRRGIRYHDEPAPTITSKVDRNRVYMGDVYNSHGCIRPVTAPAPALTASMDNGNFRWTDETDPRIQSRIEGSWRTDDAARPHHRPSTTIVGTFKPEIVAAPGYRTTVSRQNAEGSVRVEVFEAGLLQSFPADMPWQGSKSKQYLQVGNAVPPGLAIPVIGEAAGLPWQEVNAAYRQKIYGGGVK